MTRLIYFFVICLISDINANSVEDRIQELLPPGIELNSYQDSELGDFYAVNVPIIRCYISRKTLNMFLQAN